MTTTSTKTNNPPSPGKIVLFTLVSITMFILIAIACSLLTSWIQNNALKIAVREVVLRAPLTILFMHFFARRVIKAYDPAALYGKLTLAGLFKWIAISTILPVSIWLFYYVFHFIAPLTGDNSMSLADKVQLFIKWSSVSIAAGLTEEVVFRGHLFLLMSARYSKFKAMFITSLIFGLLHIYMLTSFNVLDALIVVGGGIITGMMFSFIYAYTKVIWYVVLVHVIWDIFFIGKITTIATSATDAKQALLAFKFTTQNVLLTGRGFGIEAGIPCLLTFLLLIFVLYKRSFGSLKPVAIS
ncbi:CPBP family intramembrane glutamic endopeptidase [Mucilaginibacter sp. OK098]|uniref:CPBP family intramembrane glutamic endopeptidase n=1 Tax=Mucilaginibacter sp. OK098 TaxID=1855297 RepID=UPI000910BBC7|nr:type II CAAX endopeptidase family protein [Mucilaginibacter sp. OK098]SHN21499.1 CAAX protease self-immunity [Mucilaginibacter sp. OK098]